MTKIGCLLIHGWTGEPFEMEPLVEPLERMGCMARTVLLPGHGTSFSEFRRTYWADWRAGAEAAYDALAAETDAVVVGGLSMGGLLALHLGAARPVAGVVSMAAPLFVYSLCPPRMKDWRLPLVRFLRHVRPVWPGKPRRAEAEVIAPWRGYDGAVSLPQLYSLMEGGRDVAGRLKAVTAPLLVMHCPTDATSPVENAWEILRGVASRERRLELLPIEETVTAHHMLTTHRETRERVIHFFCDFVRKMPKYDKNGNDNDIR